MIRKYLNTWQRLAEAVASERDVRGWSQQRLADEAHVPLTIVEQLENGAPTRQLNEVMRVLDALTIVALAIPPLPLEPAHA